MRRLRLGLPDHDLFRTPDGRRTMRQLRDLVAEAGRTGADGDRSDLDQEFLEVLHSGLSGDAPKRPRRGGR